MQKGKKRFFYLLLLTGFSIGIFTADVLAAFSADRKRFAIPRASTEPAEEESLDFSSIFTLQYALPFAAIAAIVIALSIYAFYSDRKGIRQD